MFERPGKLSDKLPAPYMNEASRCKLPVLQVAGGGGGGGGGFGAAGAGASHGRWHTCAAEMPL